MLYGTPLKLTLAKEQGVLPVELRNALKVMGPKPFCGIKLAITLPVSCAGVLLCAAVWLDTTHR